LVYYVCCSLYTGQIELGDSYVNLKPAISICLLSDVLFADTERPHHRFRLCDPEQDRELGDALEVHTVELTKYNLDEATISSASKIEQWAFFFLFADRYDPIRLRELLPGVEFDRAISVIETISQKTEDRTMYDQREKAQRDYEWIIQGARDEARKEGRDEGRKEGREKGLEQGLEQGLEAGCDVGILAGKIQLIQQLLGEKESARSELITQPIPSLTTTLDSLQKKLRDRNA